MARLIKTLIGSKKNFQNLKNIQPFTNSKFPHSKLKIKFLLLQDEFRNAFRQCRN